MGDFQIRLRQEFIAGVPDHRAESIVDSDVAPAQRVGLHLPDACHFEVGAQLGLARAQSMLRAFLRIDVDECADPLDNTALRIPDRDAIVTDVDVCAVLSAHPELTVKERSRLKRELPLLLQPGSIVGMQRVQPAEILGFLQRLPRELTPAGHACDDVDTRPGNPDRDGRHRHERSMPRFAQSERRFGLPLFVAVEARSDALTHVAGRVTNGRAVSSDIAIRAVARLDAILGSIRTLRFERLPDSRTHMRQVVWMHDVLPPNARTLFW